MGHHSLIVAVLAAFVFVFAASSALVLPHTCRCRCCHGFAGARVVAMLVRKLHLLMPRTYRRERLRILV